VDESPEAADGAAVPDLLVADAPEVDESSEDLTSLSSSWCASAAAVFLLRPLEAIVRVLLRRDKQLAFLLVVDVDVDEDVGDVLREEAERWAGEILSLCARKAMTPLL